MYGLNLKRRLGWRGLLPVLFVLTACSQGFQQFADPSLAGSQGGTSNPDSGQDQGGGDGDSSTEPTAAPFDCSKIQGPLSTNQFYEDNPTYIDPVDDSADWTTSTPAAQNMDAALLEQAAASMDAEPLTFSLLVIRNDALVFERYFHGSAKNHSNNVHSASKSIWGASIGS